MVRKQDFQRRADCIWELPPSFQSGMHVPVRVFADSAILEAALKDKSMTQAVNASMLPHLAGPVMVMPDVHQGYGFPIGGIAASLYPNGVISPGAIGYDINCGVRMLSTRIPFEAAKPHLPDVISALNRNCPSGVGVGGPIQLSEKELRRVCRQGSHWALKNGYARPEDVAFTEQQGEIEGADPAAVSARAMKRGRGQLGSLGAGNHFIEIDVVDAIYDQDAADAMQLSEGELTLQIHCGSRGFGHQVCSDYVRQFQDAARKYKIHLPDRELVCAPLTSLEGKAYLAAMACAANFAFCNRQLLSHYARLAFEETLAGRVKSWDLTLIYDIAHNMGKIETHLIEGQPQRVCVHRKGATRAFGPGHPDVPTAYQTIGQPVLVPGSMGTSSWILVGTEASMTTSFGSSCHGAGRTMSRRKAKKTVRGERLLEELEQQGIHVRARSMPGLAEEAPAAYKDVDAVVEVVSRAGIARKVARLRPVAVVKG